MFGLLAAFGNLGGILMPWLVEVISDRSSLRMGLATSTACPLLMPFVLLWIQCQPVAVLREWSRAATLEEIPDLELIGQGDRS